MNMYEMWYQMKYLNKNQSLRYQIMILIMLEHKKARHGKEHIGFYDGGNELYFDGTSWIKLREKLSNLISKNYKDKFLSMNDNYIFDLLSSDSELYNLRYQETTPEEYIKVFEMTDKGYRYQYNGYTRTEEKLQRKANSFILITLFYYIFSWIFESPGIKLSEFLDKLFEFSSSLKTFSTGALGAVFIIILYNLNKIRKN